MNAIISFLVLALKVYLVLRKTSLCFSRYRVSTSRHWEPIIAIWILAVVLS